MVAIKELSSLVSEGKMSFEESIKILLYQYDENIFNKLDFEQDSIYSTPFFPAIFAARAAEDLSAEEFEYQLSALVFGYSNNADFRKLGSSVQTDESGRIYIPNSGWLLTDFPKQIFTLQEIDGQFSLLLDGNPHPHEYVPSTFLQDTSIELLKYPHRLFKQFFPKEVYSEVDFTAITQRHKQTLTNTLQLIKKNFPEQFQLIEAVIHKLIIFNISPDHSNSFMARSAFGSAFFNAYQEDYNEVFFIEDISHQTGHAIFEAIINERELFFLRDSNEVLSLEGNIGRTIEVYFHSIFAYMLILKSLDSCLLNGDFTGHQLHEAYGRMIFCLKKCQSDLQTIDDEKAQTYFTKLGMDIYRRIAKSHQEVEDNWKHLFERYSLEGQPYNFEYQLFLARNPIDIDKKVTT